MSGSDQFRTLDITPSFLQSLIGKTFSEAECRRFLQALERLDIDERHPSLRIHQLKGDEQGIWSASASDQLRMTFLRQEGGRKLMLLCSRHYKQ